MNPLKLLKDKILGGKVKSKGFNPVTKIIGAKLKLIKYGAIASTISFFTPIIVIIVVVAFFVGFVEENVERVENLLRGGCLLCTNEELEQMKEDQFYTKIRLVKEAGGSKIDDVVLASTILYVGQYEDIIDSLYDEDFDEKDFGENAKDFFSSLGTTGSGEYNGIDQEQIDLLDAAVIVMTNSNVDGRYDEENYKKALASPGYGSDNFLVNGLTCIGESAGAVKDAVIHLIPFVSAITGDGNTADDIVYLFNSIDICNEGFIGGTIDSVRKMDNEEDKQKKKEQIAQDIIDFANFYKELMADDPCLYNGGNVGSGEMTNWRQCGAPWSSRKLGTSKTLCDIGCTVTSMSYLIAKSGTKLTVSSFDPGVFADNANFTSGGALYWNSWQGIAPNFEMIVQNASVNNSNAAKVLSEAISEPCNGNHQPFIVLYLSKGHWVAFDHVENGEVYVMDPSAKQGAGLVTLDNAWKGDSLANYNKFCANDVEFGTSGSSSTGNLVTDVNSDVYQERLENLDKYRQNGELADFEIVEGQGWPMRSGGCVLSSLMGIYYMYTGDDFDVREFVDDAVDSEIWTKAGQGNGMKFSEPDLVPDFTAKWGLSGEKIDASVDAIVDALSSGKKILIHLEPGSSMYPTGSGHYIMIDHINPKTNKVYVFNPNGTNTGYQSLNVVENQIIPYLKRMNGSIRSPYAISSTGVLGSDMCNVSGTGAQITIPEEFGNGGYTVTVYDDFNWVYNQGKVYDAWTSAGSVYTDGIATIDGRFLIACTETFGKVGDKIDFYLDDGTVIPSIIADIKSSGDAGYNKWGHNNGQNVLEFEVSHLAFYSIYKSNPGTNGWYEEWGGKRVSGATNLGENIIE